MKNWKTTLAAVILNAVYLILSALQAGGIEAKDIAIAVGLQAVGILAKDYDVTGGARGPTIK